MRSLALVIGFLFFPAHAGAPLTVEQTLSGIRGSTLADRIDSASVQLLGQPFLDAPLGEGPGSRYDSGPAYRLDGFDCTTFVETVLALAKSKSVSQFEKTLRQIRYRGGKASFASRNHFPCVDWIPNNTQNGTLEDITATIGAAWGVEYAAGVISKKGWALKLPPSVIRAEGLTDAERATRLKEIVTQFASAPEQTPHLAYIPLEKFINRKEVSPEERARRELEEKEVTLKDRSAIPRETQSVELDLEKQIHNEVVGVKLKYLIQDTTVDEKLLRAIPTGTILNVVKPGWKIPGTHLNVSHQGFVIQKKDAAYFRHVSKSTGRTKDVLLANYLRLCLLMPAIKGINLQQPRG
ncbi:DUF1460 domain-containing protein [bacterium]|nr:DUF1460 domain-containing protein [bacterium]